jgi:hypothetical protein
MKRGITSTAGVVNLLGCRRGFWVGVVLLFMRTENNLKNYFLEEHMGDAN